MYKLVLDVMLLIYRANMDVIEEAFLPTLNTLFNAPVTSPLSKVDVSNTAELLTQLTCTRHLVNKQLADHLQVSIWLLVFML